MSWINGTTYNRLTDCLRVRLRTCALAVVLALACTGFVAVETADADVRKADVVMGETVEERGLAVAKCPDIAAQYALVMDSEGTVYFERNAYDATQIASITKIMTAIVALEYAPLDTQISVSAEAAWVGESSAGLREGDVMTLETALTALLVSSGNDAAVAIGECLGHMMDPSRAPLAVFVEAMNAKAVELGCTSTLFANPHGLDFDQHAAEMYSTAYDVAIMARHAMKNETFRNIVSQAEATISVKRSNGASELLELESTNILLGTYEGAMGIKTGFTALAGQSFSGACNRDGFELYAIVLYSSDAYQRFWDATELFDWVYEHVIEYKLVNSSVTYTTDSGVVPLAAEVAHEDWIDRTVKVAISDPEASVTLFDLDGNVSQTVELEKLDGNVKRGEVVGTITFWQRNVALATYDLVAVETVNGPNIFEGVGVWFERLMRSFKGEPQMAETVILNETPLINDKTSV